MQTDKFEILLSSIISNSCENFDERHDPFTPEQTQQLCQALSKNTSIRSIEFSGHILSLEDTKALGLALKINSSLYSLSLRDAGLDDKTFAPIAASLVSNKSLIYLLLTRNKLGEKGAKLLTQSLATNKTLKLIDLYENKIGIAGAEAFADLFKLNYSLTSLRLCDNELGDTGITVLLEPLSAYRTICSLDIRRNSIGPIGARAIAQLLKSNKSLKDLAASFNQFGDEGLGLIAEALKVNNSLTQIQLDHNEFTATAKDNIMAVINARLELNDDLNSAELRLEKEEKLKAQYLEQEQKQKFQSWISKHKEAIQKNAELKGLLQELYLSILNDDAAKLETILVRYPFLIELGEFHHDSALGLALAENKLKCAEILLKKGANPNKPYSQIFSLAHYCFLNNPPNNALEKIKLLLRYQMDINLIANVNGALVHNLILLAGGGDQLITALDCSELRQKIDINKQNASGDTALHLAINLCLENMNVYLSMVRALLQNGARTDILNDKYLTAIDSIDGHKNWYSKEWQALMSPLFELLKQHGLILQPLVEAPFPEALNAKPSSISAFSDVAMSEPSGTPSTALFAQFKQFVQNQAPLNAASCSSAAAASPIVSEELNASLQHSKATHHKHKIGWELMLKHSQKKYFSLIQQGANQVKVNINTLNKNLNFIDLRQATDYHCIVHTTASSVAMLTLIKEGAHFLNNAGYLSASLIDKATPPAMMSHQRNLLFPIHLILDVPAHNILYTSPVDIASPTDLQRKDLYMQELMQDVQMMNWLQAQYQKSHGHLLSLAAEYTFSSPTLVQKLLEQDSRYQSPSYCQARGALPFLTVESLLKQTNHEFYNEILIGNSPNNANSADIKVIGIAVEQDWLDEFLNNQIDRLTHEERKQASLSLDLLANLGLPLCLIKTEKLAYLDKLSEIERKIAINALFIQLCKQVRNLGQSQDKPQVLAQKMALLSALQEIIKQAKPRLRNVP